MSVVLSPLGVGWQFFGGATANSSPNIPLANGSLAIYQAGTSTPVTTYTSSTGLTPNAWPIVLDSTGRVPYEIWWALGASYKAVLRDGPTTGSNVISTWDNIPGINDPLSIATSSSLTSIITYFSTVETYITQPFGFTANSLAVGMSFRITVSGRCTSSVANNVTFNVRIGTAGFLADTSVSQFVVPAATSGTGTIWMAEIMVTITATGASAATASGMLLTNAASTGIFAGVATAALGGGNATFNSTTATNLGLSMLTAAGTTTVEIITATVEYVR